MNASCFLTLLVYVICQASSNAYIINFHRHGLDFHRQSKLDDRDMSTCQLVAGTNEGLVPSPPMGWISSERFGCNTDCVNYPEDCISEHLVKTTVDAIFNGDLRTAGFRYVILGDCWQNRSRGPDGILRPDPKRFPLGMKDLADYVHKRGMKLGISIDLGNETLNGYPGCLGHYHRDAETLTGWGVDMVYAAANSLHESHDLNTAYPSMAQELKESGRDIVYGCEWPLNLIAKGMQVNYTVITKTCQLYRTHKDMLDSWGSLEEAVKFYADRARAVRNYSRPGHWHDPGPLLVGDYGLSANQEKIQLATWIVMTSPLLVSADLRHLPPVARQLILNKETLNLANDPLFCMGYEVTLRGQVHVWKKSILPAGSFALLLMYFNISGGPTKFSVKLQDIGFTGAAAYNLTDVFSGNSMGTYKPWYTLDCEVEPTGAVFLKAVAIP